MQIGTSLTDNGYQLGSESASSIGPSARGGDTWARALSDQSFDWVNKGESGDTIQLIEARLPADVYPEHPDAVIVEAGTNNSGETYETIIGRLTTLYAALQAKGYTVIPLTVAMRESGVWSDTVRDKMLDVNTWIKSNYSNAIEINKYFSDPATDRPYANYTDDGTHWTNLGGYAVGKAIAEAITVSGSRDLFGTAINSSAALTGTGGSKDAGITGTVPTGIHLDIVGSHSGTAVATANDPGLTMEFTPGGSASTEDYDIRTNPLDTTVTVGTLYELLSQIEISSWDGWNYIELRLYDPGNTSHYDLLQMLNEDTYGYPQNEALDLFLRSPQFEAADTGVRIYIKVGVDPDATGTGTITLSNLHLQEWTRPSLTNVPTITGWTKKGTTYTGLGTYAYIGSFSATDICYADASNNAIGRLRWDDTDEEFDPVGSALTRSMGNNVPSIDGYGDGEKAVLAEYISATQIRLIMYEWNDSTEQFDEVSGSSTTITSSGFQNYLQVKVAGGTIYVASGSTLIAASWNGTDFDHDATQTGLTDTRVALAALTSQTCVRWNETNDTYQYHTINGSGFDSNHSIVGASTSGALGITALEDMRILGWANANNTVESFDSFEGKFYENNDDSAVSSDISNWPRTMAKLTNERVAIKSFGGGGNLITIEATTS